jgi:peroxiredoxin
MLTPRQSVPSLAVDTVANGRFLLLADAPEHFTLVVFYRGLHCPICAKYLMELERLVPEFERRGVKTIAISSDNAERGAAMAEKIKASGLRVGYGLSLESARAWGLYISESRGTTSIGIEEPALFFRTRGVPYPAGWNALLWLDADHALCPPELCRPDRCPRLHDSDQLPGARRIHRTGLTRSGETAAQVLEAESGQQLGQALGRLLRWQFLVHGNDQLVLQRVLPADEFGHRQLIAVRFELQAAQGVGQLAAEFAGVDRMPPEFRQRRVWPRIAFFLRRSRRGDFGLAAGDENDELACRFWRAKRIASSVAVSQACSAVTMSMTRGQLRRIDGVLDAQVEEGHARESRVATARLRELSTSSSRASTP